MLTNVYIMYERSVVTIKGLEQYFFFATQRHGLFPVNGFGNVNDDVTGACVTLSTFVAGLNTLSLY